MQSSGDATGSFKRNSTQQEKMRHLLVLLIFALILTVPCCGKGGKGINDIYMQSSHICFMNI